MPRKAPSLRACGCVVSSGSKCFHADARDAARKKAFDQKRPSARARGYDSKWQTERAAFLSLHTHCEHAGCSERATVVDHIKPHRGDKKLFWSRSNWQALCAHHHNSAKQREERNSP